MSGVEVTFLRAEPIVAELRTRAKQLAEANEQIVEVSLFGSLVSGNYCPGSDADILVILRKDDRRLIDRLDEFLVQFSGLGIAVDVFPSSAASISAITSLLGWGYGRPRIMLMCFSCWQRPRLCGRI